MNQRHRYKPDADYHRTANAETDAPEIARNEVATFLPSELLQSGEIIILMLKPSPWYILLAALRSVLAILLVAAALYSLADQTILGISIRRTDVILLAAGLLAVRLFWQFLEWLSRVYVLTDRRVIRVKGVIHIDVFEASLKQIQHTGSHFSLLERLFGLGTLSFATAGTGIPEALWEMLSRPLDAHQTVVRTLERYR